MGLDELYEKLKTLGIPCAYHHFIQKVSPPYVVYIDDESESISADAKNFGLRRYVRVYLCTEDSMPDLEARLEAVLDGCAFDKTKLWLDSEEMYQVSYDLELIEKGDT